MFRSVLIDRISSCENIASLFSQITCHDYEWHVKGRRTLLHIAVDEK